MLFFNYSCTALISPWEETIRWIVHQSKYFDLEDLIDSLGLKNVFSSINNFSVLVLYFSRR